VSQQPAGTLFTLGAVLTVDEWYDGMLTSPWYVHLSTSSVPLGPNAAYPPAFPEPVDTGYPIGGQTVESTAINPGIGTCTFTVLWNGWTFAGSDTIAQTVYQWWIESPGSSALIAFGSLSPPLTIPSGRVSDYQLETNLAVSTCAVSPPPPPAPYSRDTFQATGGTLLSATTPDAGPSWGAFPGHFELAIGFGGGNCSAAANAICDDTMSVGATDYIVRVNYTHQTNTWPSVLFRVVDSGDYWRIGWDTSSNWMVVQSVGGTETSVVSGGSALTAGTTYTLVIVVQGAAISLVVSGEPAVGYGAMSTSLTGMTVGLIVIPSGSSQPTGVFAAWGVDSVIPSV
jgi:hypothetical protein